MDDISAESLGSLLQKKIKIEVNNRVISGELIAVKGDIVIFRMILQGTMKDIQIHIDDIDAIMLLSKGKLTEP